MSMRSVWVFLFLAVLLVLFGSGCGTQPYVPERAVAPAGKDVGEGELEAIPEPISSEKKPVVEEDTAPVYVEQEEPAGVEEADVVSGYRVQVFASSSLERAEEVASQARAIFVERIYVEYSVPLYKVRIGDFASKEKALEFRERAIEAGYEGAWVAEAIIEPE